MYAMQEQNRVTGKGLVFTRWIWFTSPVHAFGGIWSACFVLAVLRMTTTTLVSTWCVLFTAALPIAGLKIWQQSTFSSLMKLHVA